MVEDLSVSKKKPKNRYEEFVKPKFDDFVNYIKDALKDIDNPFEDVSFAVGTGVERAFKQMVKRDQQRAKETFPDLYRRWKSGEEFNKGGTVMKDQMQMAFMQEGGLKDDGMDVDPVSGNDVPPGSMASEVRDDIPAQLSEGEYVVPADVVQYFGVKFFEDLRMEAKRGLADMESNGRIGGEPMDMPMDGMNQGGMMQGNEQTMPVDTGVGYNVGGATSNPYNNPTKMDQQVSNVMADNPQNMDMQNRTQAMMSPEQMDQANPPPPPRGFNPGGSVVPMPTVPNIDADSAAAYNYIASPTTINPIFATPGATYMAPPDPAEMVSNTPVDTPSDEYCDKVGMDYDPTAKMCIPRPVTIAPEQGGGDGDGAPEVPKVDPGKWMEEFDYSGTDEGMQNLLQQSLDLLDPPERTGLGEVVGGILDKGIFGKFSAGSNAAKVAANMILLDHYGVDTTALNTKYQDYVKTNLSGVPKGLYNGDSFAKQIAIKHGLSLSLSAEDPFGDKIFKGRDDYRKFLENDERKENIRSRYRDMSINPLISTGKELTEKQKQDAKSDAGLSKVDAIVAQQDDDGPSAAQIAAARKEGDRINKQQTAKIKDRYSTDTKTAIKQMKDKGTFNVGGRNKGGLMTKKKKKK